MVLNLNMSIHLNILVLLSPLIYYGFLTSNVSTLNHVKSLEPSTVTSISMILLNLFSLFITPLSFPILPVACFSVWNPPVSSTNSEILQKQQHFALKMCSHKWDSYYSFLLSTFICLKISENSRHFDPLIYPFFLLICFTKLIGPFSSLRRIHFRIM